MHDDPSEPPSPSGRISQEDGAAGGLVAAQPEAITTLEPAAPLPAALPPEATARAAIESAEALLDLQGDPAAWAALSDEALASTIQSYRSAVACLEAGLLPESLPARRTDVSRSGSEAPEAGAARGSSACAGQLHGGTHGAAAAHGEYQVGSVDDLDPSEWQVPLQCIPIHANVTTYDWAQLYDHTQVGGNPCQPAIMLDLEACCEWSNTPPHTCSLT